MSDQLLKDLETYSAIGVALESSVNVPSDAQKILAIFMGGNSQVSNEAGTDDSSQGTLSRVNSKIKETIKNLIQWVMDRFQEFKNWAREYMLGREQAEKEVAAAKELLNGHPIFKSDKITLLPNITGALAVEGRLDETFPDKMTRLRDIIDLIVEVRDDVIALSSNVIADLNKYIGDQQEGESDVYSPRNEIILEYEKISSRLARVLTQPKPTIPGTATKKTVFSKGQYEKVQDIASMPLPGGYALTSTYVKQKERVIFGTFTNRGTNNIILMAELLDALSPNLEKVYSSGITFSGNPLDARKSNQVIDECEKIISTIKRNPEKAQGIENELFGYRDLVAAIDNNEVGTKDLYFIGSLMKASLKLMESDRYKTYRYAIKTVRASLRYISASIDKKPQEEISPAMRLGAPA